MDKHSIYKKCLDRWGIDSQLLMAVEEMTELQTELLHCIRGRGDLKKVSEEIADVMITLEQVLYIYALKSSVNKNIEIKMNRLESILIGEKDKEPTND